MTNLEEILRAKKAKLIKEQGEEIGFVTTDDFKKLKKKVDKIKDKVKKSDSGAEDKEVKYKEPSNIIETQILAIIEGNYEKDIPVTLTDIINCNLEPSVKIEACSILIKNYREQYSDKKVKINLDISLLDDYEKLELIEKEVQLINGELQLMQETNTKKGFKIYDLGKELVSLVGSNFELLAIAYGSSNRVKV